MDGWIIHTSHPRCDGRARARPRAWRMTAPPSIQPLPSVLTCTLLAFSQLFHRQAEDLGQRVTKEEVEGPAWPRGSSLPQWGNLFTTSSSLGKLLKQLAFTKKKKKSAVICISEVNDISPSNLDSSLCFLQPSVSHDVLCI